MNSQKEEVEDAEQDASRHNEEEVATDEEEKMINEEGREELFYNAIERESAGQVTNVPELAVVHNQATLMNLMEELEDLDSDDDGPSSPSLLTRKWNINAKRKLANENLQLQAKKMLKMSDKKFPSGNVGNNVKICVPDVDRGKCGPRNVIGVITECDDQRGLYRIGTQYGTVNTMFTRSQFDICHESFINAKDVPSGSISLRECYGKDAISGSQWYKRCGCKTGCNEGRKGSRCKCRREGNLCNSKCHDSLSCTKK